MVQLTPLVYNKWTLEKPKGQSKMDNPSRETGNIGYTSDEKKKKKTQHNMC